jgi:hypothetical protein
MPENDVVVEMKPVMHIYVANEWETLMAVLPPVGSAEEALAACHTNGVDTVVHETDNGYVVMARNAGISDPNTLIQDASRDLQRYRASGRI